MRKKSLPKKIKASKDLQNRVGTGNIDQHKIDEAQRIIDTSKVDFGEIAKPELNKLQKAIDKARKNPQGDEVMESFMTPIMNIKANAGAFNYKFVSDLTGMILMFLEGIDESDRKVVQIVDVLHKTILLALAYQMKGDGGENGKALLSAFKEICAKYHRKKKNKT